MSYSELEPQGLSHLVEAATALATFSTCSTAPMVVDDHSNRNIAKTSCSGETTRDGISNTPDLRVETLTNTNGVANSSGSKELFPERLMSILNDESVCRDVISWLPNGRSFIITRPDIFMESVLPLYINPVQQPKEARTSSPKYPSFTRKLNRWGFRQITRGPETGAFHHPLFRRDIPELCVEMVCQRSRGTPKADRRSDLPAKKRRVSSLTKESLEAMNQLQTTEFNMTPGLLPVSTHAVCVSEDSSSLRSSFSGASPPASDAGSTPVASIDKSMPPTVLVGGGVTNDVKLVQRAISKRNEEERMRVAKVMLYNSFLQAMNGEEV